LVTNVGNKIWDIDISGSIGSDGTVQVWSDDGTDSIRKLTVTDTNTNGSRLNIFIQNPNQSTTRVVNITGWLGDAIVFTDQPFDLKVVEISGNLNGRVDANTVGTIDVGGSIDSDIQSMGDIDQILAIGDIKGSISTIDISGRDKYGRIRQVLADNDKNGVGNLGAPGAGNELVIKYGSLVTVGNHSGNTGMELLRGANAYINLDGTFGDPQQQFGNAGGWFARFETTDVNNGIFSGSFKVNRLVDLGGGLSDIDIKGNINAAIIVDWLDRTLLQCGGDFNGSYQSNADFWFNPGSNNAHPGNYHWW